MIDASRMSSVGTKLFLSMALTLTGSCATAPNTDTNYSAMSVEFPDEVTESYYDEVATPSSSGTVLLSVNEAAPSRIDYDTYDGLDIVDGDMIIRRVNNAVGDNDALTVGTKWPSATIPYEIDNSVPAATKTRIANAIKHWEDKTIVRFVQRTNEANYVIFKRGATSSIGSSDVGMIGGKQEIYLGDKVGRSVTIHEIGHTVGLIHEHNRGDRDKYIKIIWGNIKSKRRKHFNKSNFIPDKEYDYASRMHYKSNARAINPKKPTIKPLNSRFRISNDGELSPGDISYINMIYNR